MKRPTIISAVVLGAALFLAACDISVTPAPPLRPADRTVTAGDEQNTTVGQFTLAPGQDVLVRVNVATSRPLLFLELTHNVDLEVFSSGRSRLASASSPVYFGAGTSGLASAGLDTQAIQVSVACDASCVILPRTSSHYFVLITNTSGASQNIGLFAFGDFYGDEFEPGNNDPGSAAPLILPASESGALETLGDVDYWRVQGNGRIILDATNGALDIVAYITDTSGRPFGPYAPGNSFEVFNGDLVRVQSGNGRAAASADSLYFLSTP